MAEWMWSSGVARMSDTTAELAEAQTRLEGRAGGTAGATEIPAEVVALLDECWEANEPNDGSVIDLCISDGYHLYGETKYALDSLTAHLQQAVNPKWITEPYLIVAQQIAWWSRRPGLR